MLKYIPWLKRKAGRESPTILILSGDPALKWRRPTLRELTNNSRNLGSQQTSIKTHGTRTRSRMNPYPMNKIRMRHRIVGRSKILMNSPKILRKLQPMMKRREKTTRNQHLQVPLNQMRKKAIRTMTMMTTTSPIRKMRHTAVDII